MSNAEKVLSEVMNALDNFEIDKKIIPLSVEGNIADILNMDKQSISRSSSENLALYSYELTRYAYYLQTLLNYELSNVRIAKEALSNIIGKNYAAYKSKFSTHDEVKMKIIAGNDAAREYNRLLMMANARVDRLSFLSTRIQNMAQALDKIVQSRRGNNNG